LSTGLNPSGLTLLATAIGSLPHTDPVAACRVMTDNLPIPAWPQLPRRSFKENMYAQYSEGFPGVVVDEGHERIWVDRSRDLDGGLERLYAAYMENDLDFAAISAEYAAGFHAFLDVAAGRSWPAVKGSVTGPISWGLTVTDEDERAILYDDSLADAVAKHLRLKAAWQERELRKLSNTTIIFVDEPYMSAYGSAFFSLEREMVLRLLTETMAGIKGLVGVHCCGNTDWSLLLETRAHVLNFDAYAYAESVALYPEAVRAFLRRGGLLAWGIVPAEDEEAIAGETAGSLTDRLLVGMSLLVKKGIPLDHLLDACLVSPSCGLRGRSEAIAVRALQLAVGVTEELRRRFGR
jgi:methionine synthase II (cobalamin-independent)